MFSALNILLRRWNSFLAYILPYNLGVGTGSWESRSLYVECNSYGLTMWEVKTKYTVRTLGPIGSGG